MPPCCLLVRWRSKVAENEAMISADLNNNLSRKKTHRENFLELEKVGDPLILTAFYKGNFTQNQPTSNGFRAQENFPDDIFFRKNIF